MYVASVQKIAIAVSDFSAYVTEMHNDRDYGFEVDYDVSIYSQLLIYNAQIYACFLTSFHAHHCDLLLVHSIEDRIAM